MNDQIPPEDSIPSERLNSLGNGLTEQQELAASIEQDFRSLLVGLERCQSMADSKIAPHIDRVKAVVERGIGLSLRLRTLTDAKS